MSAGLPGLGLGGLFFIFSALLAPFPELWRTLRGRSDRDTWKAIGRQLAQALAMIAAIDVTLRLTYLVLSAAGVGNPPAAAGATVLPLGLIGITTGLLVTVLCGAKLAELGMRARSRGLPQVPDALPRVAPLRAAGLGAIAVVAWVALLVAGASELSPLQRHQRPQIASRPEQHGDGKPRQAAAEPRRQARSNYPAVPAAVETIAGVSPGVAGTRGGAAPPTGGGEGAGVAPSPAVPVPGTPPSKPPPAPAVSPPATPAPNGPPGGGPAAEAPAGAGGKPESTGPPEDVPASGGTGPAAEPPPQAPAKGLRE